MGLAYVRCMIRGGTEYAVAKSCFRSIPLRGRYSV